MLRTAGRFVTIFTAERTADILSQMRIERIEPKMIRMIHSRRDAEARLILVEGLKGGRPGLSVASPLILYDDSGAYTAEVQRMFEL
jgi:tRNA1Val (adenine37-N6)-methyltransferase